MENMKTYILFLTLYLWNGVYSKATVQEQMQHIIERKLESTGKIINPSRRFFLDQDNVKEIVGTPSFPYHLPEASPLEPGHTLIRPSVGALRSQIKYPHRELENGAGVLGNIKNLGITYRNNERVLYTGFRRNMNGNQIIRKKPSPDKEYDFIAVVVPNRKKQTPKINRSTEQKKFTRRRK